MHHFTCEKDMNRFLEQQTWKKTAVHNAARKVRLRSHLETCLEMKQTHIKDVAMRSLASEYVTATKRPPINYKLYFLYHLHALPPKSREVVYASKWAGTEIQAIAGGIKQQKRLVKHFCVRQHPSCRESLHFYSASCCFSQIPTHHCSGKLTITSSERNIFQFSIH